MLEKVKPFWSSLYIYLFNDYKWQITGIQPSTQVLWPCGDLFSSVSLTTFTVDLQSRCTSHYWHCICFFVRYGCCSGSLLSTQKYQKLSCHQFVLIHILCWCLGIKYMQILCCICEGTCVCLTSYSAHGKENLTNLTPTHAILMNDINATNSWR